MSSLRSSIQRIMMKEEIRLNRKRRLQPVFCPAGHIPCAGCGFYSGRACVCPAVI